MSTERPSFGFNSLIPTSYKTKAEAFAKCLQDKLMSLSGFDDGSDSVNNGKRRLSKETIETNGNVKSSSSDNENGNCTFDNVRTSFAERNGNNQNGIDDKRCSSDSEESYESEARTDEDKEIENVKADVSENYRNGSDTSATSDLVLNSHKQSELLHKRVHELLNADEIENCGRKLVSLSSEDSTVESWCSCEDLNDESDEDEDEIDHLASQIRGSPILRNVKLRNRKRGYKENESWKKSRESCSSNDLFSDFDSECFSPVNLEEQETSPQIEDEQFKPFDMENYDVPFRILRESSSTGNLEKMSNSNEKSLLEASEPYNDLLTPPPSPESGGDLLTTSDCVINVQNLEKSETRAQEIACEDKADDVITEAILIENYAEVETYPTEQTEEIKDEPEPNFCSTFTKMGGMVVECPCPSLIIERPYDDLFDEVAKSEESREEANREPEKKEEDEEMLNPRMKLRRCSSLKTWKTPPGTPGRKKIVRFADALGLDLADVRTFLDEIPKIPISAYEDLQLSSIDTFPTFQTPPQPPTPCRTPTLIPMFPQPGGQADFIERVRNFNVCLESAILTDTTVLTVSGCVRVRNLDFNKSVHVRYSIDNWSTFSDLQATYVPNSCDGFSDKFSFVLYGHTLKIGEKLEFALRLECLGCQHWDNNSGRNYVFQCLPQSPTSGAYSPLSISPSDAWSTKFY